MSGMFKSRTIIRTGWIANVSIACNPEAASMKPTSVKLPSAARTIFRIVGESSTTRMVRIGVVSYGTYLLQILREGRD